MVFSLQFSFLFDTYFDAIAMTGNKQLFILAQCKISTSFPGYSYPH